MSSEDIAEEPRALTEDELWFLQEWTNHEVESAVLKRFVVDFWKKHKDNYHMYGCIQDLQFLQPRLALSEESGKLIDDLVTHPEKRWLELGCCFGTDLRYLISKGVAPASLAASDIHDGYFKLGKELFSVPSSVSAKKNEEKVEQVESVFGDMASEDTKEGGLDLSGLGWEGRFDYVSCFAILHVLSESQIRVFLKHVFQTLKPGAMAIGVTVASDTPRTWRKTPDGKDVRFLHSQASLTELVQELGYTDSDICYIDFPYLRNNSEDLKLLKFILHK